MVIMLFRWGGMMEHLSVRVLILQSVFSVARVCIKQHSSPLERK